MERFTTVIFGLAYMAISILKLVAIYAGLHDELSWHWLGAGALAIFTALIPVVGELLAIWGAIYGFGWGMWFSVILFTLPYLVYGLLMAIGILAALLSALFSWITRQPKNYSSPSIPNPYHITEPSSPVDAESDMSNDGELPAKRYFAQAQTTDGQTVTLESLDSPMDINRQATEQGLTIQGTIKSELVEPDPAPTAELTDEQKYGPKA
ncbi:hypothetical protein H5P28_11725 [Ruficoccus amylovorans]|uniref:Uncharacterized protein n=1 Tax=Ruficoccus amylovorans TaxID=1804625 RepID=A0A842HH26_9BACT|nr:hypothetical protein [Ruficoccus amylovorans]MBC2594926.1 hypothetical protein [Ruficoccus amylovorans]